MGIVDANVVLRYLLDDHAELSARAAEILEGREVSLPVEVACEVVYVLQKVYAIGRHPIRQQLGDLINERLVSMERPVVFLKALDCYAETTLDFVDCLLWAYHLVEHQAVFTFDDKLRKSIDGV
jgi:predicted nucleic-acid-binding protein